MRCLYFDIDGTVVHESIYEVKPALGEGRFQDLVTRCGFDQVFCVSNMITTIELVREHGVTEDGSEIIYGYCGGAFTDEEWVRENVKLIHNPERRVQSIDFAGDWWFVDNEARYYFECEDRVDDFVRFHGTRVCMPTDDGDGVDVANWLEGLRTR